MSEFKSFLTNVIVGTEGNQNRPFGGGDEHFRRATFQVLINCG